MSRATLLPTPLTQRTDALVARVDQATESLLARFSAIAELSFSDQDVAAGRNASTAAATSLEMEDHAHQMIKAAQDLRTIVREVKEAWILGDHSEHGRAEEDDQVEDATMVEDTDAQLRSTLIQLGTQYVKRAKSS